MEGLTEELKIPEVYQQLCKDIAGVIRKHQMNHSYFTDETKQPGGVYSFTGKFSPMASGPEWGEIQFHWESGRHYDEIGKITITSNYRVETTLNNQGNE